MMMGLTTEGPSGDPIPGAATHWEVTPDGLTWTFHLRPHLWSDGVPVTSADFVAAWWCLLDPKTAAVEGQVFQQMVQRRDFDLAMPSWIADYNDAGNFLDLLRSDSGENYSGYANPRYDALLDAAASTPDPKARAAKLLQAEELALADYAWVPAWFMVTRDLVSPRVKGWIANARNINRTRWLGLDP